MGEENIIGSGQSYQDVSFVPVDVVESVKQGHKIYYPAENIKIKKYFGKKTKRSAKNYE